MKNYGKNSFTKARYILPYILDQWNITESNGFSKVEVICYFKELNIDNLDFSEFYKEYLIISAINRSKLNIYNKAIPNLFKKFQITNFKMYLFEYNFGFYINKLIRRNLKKS